MKMLNTKVKSFLKDLQDKPEPTDGERLKALELIAETMLEKNLLMVQTKQELEDISKRISVRTDRLVQIRDRINLAIKAGIANDTVH